MSLLLYIYLVIINVISFICFGIDKKKAIIHSQRIPERCLFLLSIVGGSFGANIGMKFFHHKTRKKAFSLGIPFILLVVLSFTFLIPIQGYKWFVSIVLVLIAIVSQLLIKKRKS